MGKKPNETHTGSQSEGRKAKNNTNTKQGTVAGTKVRAGEETGGLKQGWLKHDTTGQNKKLVVHILEKKYNKEKWQKKAAII